jgi:hypothetical protein
LIAPSITGPLAIQLPPTKFDMGPLGDVYLNGIGSGLGQWQNNVVPNILPGNRAIQPDLSNGQVFVQKTDGIFSFMFRPAPALPDLGGAHIRGPSHLRDQSPAGNLWGWLPGLPQDRAGDNFSIKQASFQP